MTDDVYQVLRSKSILERLKFIFTGKINKIEHWL